eukprot:1088199-Amorphochlora_amoeboformis.AAC.2
MENLSRILVEMIRNTEVGHFERERLERFGDIGCMQLHWNWRPKGMRLISSSIHIHLRSKLGCGNRLVQWGGLEGCW